MKPYQHQRKVITEGRQILDKYKMLYLPIETRVGKTLIALTLAEDNGSVLFVTTKSAIKGVQETCEQSGLYLPDIIITNYEQLHNLPLKEYDTVIVDECHKISSFPKKNLARKRLDNFIGNETNLILMSGTPHTESSSQMFHQFSLSPHHRFAEYSTFYKWFKDYGVAQVKFIGRGITANDYTKTYHFENKWRPFTITMTREEAGFDHHTPKIIRRYVEMPDELLYLYTRMQVEGIVFYIDHRFIAEGGGASKLTKLQQIASGTCIDDEDKQIIIDNYKVKYIEKHWDPDEVVVLYKYQAEKRMLDELGYESLQIDSGTTGMDFSHKSTIVAMTLTFSGANFIQAITRMANKERDTPMPVYIILANHTIDSDILDTVEQKKNFNQRVYHDTRR